jgi:hypothetical protein
MLKSDDDEEGSNQSSAADERKTRGKLELGINITLMVRDICLARA